MTSVIDIGPLSWVKSEIDSSLERARASLNAFASNPEDRKSLKAAQTHLHQAYGAVQIVGLLGVSRFFERLNAWLRKSRREASPPSLPRSTRSTARRRPSASTSPNCSMASPTSRFACIHCTGNSPCCGV